jgi:hypothetical protein
MSRHKTGNAVKLVINPLNAELKLICHLVALLGAYLIFHVGRIMVKKTAWESVN